MEGLFIGAKSQYIDSSGYTRLIKYDHNVILITPPLSPLKLDLTTKDQDRPKIDRVVDFIKTKNLIPKIVDLYQVQNEEVIEGVWIEDPNKQILYGYLPFQTSKIIPDIFDNIAVAPETLIPPIVIHKGSLLKTMRTNKKIATYLKHYANYLYSQNGNIDESFFTIIPNHVYDISDMTDIIDLKNPQFMKNGKLIVTSEDMRKRLLYSVKISVLNGVIDDTVYVKGLYTALSDFDVHYNELIFMNEKSLFQWKDDKIQNNNNVYYTLQPNATEPYFYSNYYTLDNEIVMIQNTKNGSLESALFIIDQWIKEQVNLGYKINKKKTVDEYNVYEAFGNVDVHRDTPYNVVRYHNNTYGAILRFNGE